MKSGFVTLVGRPNVGKSTLLNQVLGQKVTIVSDKPQTTRTQVRGVLTRPDAQVVFTCDYGDYHHTQQALQVGFATEVERNRLAESAYSQSGFSLENARDDEWAWHCPDCDEVYPPDLAPLMVRAHGKCKCGSTNVRKVDEDGEPIDADGDLDEAPGVVVLSMDEIE